MNSIQEEVYARLVEPRLLNLVNGETKSWPDLTSNHCPTRFHHLVSNEDII
jgi:hypothetical protein